MKKFVLAFKTLWVQLSFKNGAGAGKIKYIHSGMLGYTRLQFYDINLVSFKIAYHELNEEIRSWPFLSKQIKIRGFWKCKVHCCNFKGFKVTSLQSSAWNLNLGLPRESLNIEKMAHTGGSGSNPSQAELWRLVILKPLQLQQCTLHFQKPPVFI